MVDSAWVALGLADHVGGKTLRRLLEAFGGDPHAVLAADGDALRRVPGIGPKIAHNIQQIDLAAVEAAIPRWLEAGVRLVPLGDPAYPSALAALDDAPPTLFVRGVWPAPLPSAVAVVGTRRPSPDAERLASWLGSELAGRGLLVVSGLAVGVDRAAHLGALADREGITVAVLGSGVLSVYPTQNAALAQAVTGRGALVSEVHPLAKPSPSNLVARNRIISGLCGALIVVETGVEGGAMHAARRAWEQGRRVYVADSPASGNRALLEQGAIVLPHDLGSLEV